MIASSQYFKSFHPLLSSSLPLAQWASLSLSASLLSFQQKLLFLFPNISRAFFTDSTLVLDRVGPASWPWLMDQHCTTSVWSKHVVLTWFVKVTLFTYAKSWWFFFFFATAVLCITIKELGPWWQCTTFLPQMLSYCNSHHRIWCKHKEPGSQWLRSWLNIPFTCRPMHSSDGN